MLRLASLIVFGILSLSAGGVFAEAPKPNIVLIISDDQPLGTVGRFMPQTQRLIFDQGLGDIFSIRIAGNILNEDILGSMEFGCKVAGAKIIVVLGHTKCGAVKGACDHVEMGNLTSLLTKIRPAVDDETATKENRNSSNAVFVENVATINVKRTVKAILERSPILKEMIETGQIGIIGGTHEISTGEVSFYSETSNLHI